MDAVEEALLYGMVISFAAAIVVCGIQVVLSRHKTRPQRNRVTYPAQVDLARVAAATVPIVHAGQELSFPVDQDAATSQLDEDQYRPETPNALPSSVPSQPMVLVRVLDQASVFGPAGEADCSRGKDVADLLGLLVVHRDGLSREKAYHLLWPDVGLDNYDCFHGPKSEIRDKLVRVMGATHQGKNLLLYAGGRYRLNPHLITTDLWQLHDALSQARRTDDPENAAMALRKAVELYTGPFLPVSVHPWAVEVAEDLRRDVVSALLRLSQLDSDPDRITGLLSRAHKLDPANEEVSCQLMRHFSTLGRNDAVFQVYQELRHVLEDLGGLTPSTKTRELYSQLIGQSP